MAARKRVKIINPNRFGDWLVTIPALRWIRETRHVTISGDQTYTHFLLDLDEVDAVDLSEAKPRQYDQLMAWSHINLSAYVMSVHAKEKNYHHVWQYIVRIVGGNPDTADTKPVRVPLAWLDRAREALSRIDVDPDSRFGVVQPKSRDGARVPDPNRLVRLIEDSGVDRLMLHQGPDDDTSAFVSAWGRAMPTLIDPDLETLAGVCSLASVYLGCNTGVMHLAAAVGTPVRVSLNSQACRAWLPWGAPIERVDLPDGEMAEAKRDPGSVLSPHGFRTVRRT
jgi:hypothetical protein